jgi:Tfp pilus assembly protein PilV
MLRSDVRSGFTLIEVIIALVLFELAMLALAALAWIAARDLAAANLGARALEMARNRVEQLRITSCSSAESGHDVGYGMTEIWSVRDADRVRVVSDSIEYALPDGRRRRLVLYATVLCST